VPNTSEERAPGFVKAFTQIVIALCMLAGAGGAWWYFYAAPAGGAAQQAARPNVEVPVEAVPVSVGPIQRRLTAVGSLRSNESVIVRPEIAGRIAEFKFQEGQRVKQGQPLVVLDDSVWRAELEQAQAALELANSNYERAVDLLKRKAGTTKARDETLAELRADQAALELAKARLDKTVLKAPFDGVIGLRKVSVGEFVDAGADIVNLEQIDPLKVDFRVAEVYVASVKPGQELDLGVDAFPGEKFTGKVYAIDPLIDENGRSILLRASLPNPDGRLRPGLFARISLVLNERDNAIQVPEQALVPQGQEQFVFKVVDGKAAFTKVKVGIRRNGMAEITDGLAPGDVVVTAGQLKIRDGVPVKVVPKAEV
jgi:membrane fusion protein (multidrug efflux system)